MDIKNYSKATGLNMLMLAIGALLGPIVVHSDKIFNSTVHAQNSQKGAATKNDPPVAALDPNIEYIEPSLSTGAALFGTVLAHRVACDLVIANDIDILKLHEGELNLLVSRGYIKAFEARQLIANSKVSKPLRVRALGASNHATNA